jgi:hypothetical protein
METQCTMHESTGASCLFSLVHLLCELVWFELQPNQMHRVFRS